jgi:hypothetical protein
MICTEARPFVVEVVTTSGRAAGIEFRPQNVVEPQDSFGVWHHQQLRAVFDRPELTWWLAHPGALLEQSGVMLTWCYAVDSDGRPAITLHDVTGWTLSPTEHHELESRVRAGVNDETALSLREPRSLSCPTWAHGPAPYQPAPLRGRTGHKVIAWKRN